MSNKEKNNRLQLHERESTKFYIQRFSLMAHIIIGLSLFSFACQKPAQSNSTSNAAHTSTNTSSGMSQESGAPVAPQTSLKVGDRAPDFTLTDTNGQQIKLSDFRGKKNVVLAFYVMAFTGG
jgi:cytochrome oxidase Cu insertion factor (SCO1/SenC/PrrC family)